MFKRSNFKDDSEFVTVCDACDAHIRFNWVDISPTPPSLPMADSHNSARNLTADSSATNFAAIFEAASNNYKTLVGQDLRTHPLALELESGNSSPDSILAVFRKQAQALDKFRNGDDKLIKSLTPIVNILSTFSTTADIGLVHRRFLAEIMMQS